MSSEIPDSDKVQLLFKEFTGVTNVKQSTAFPGENFAFTDYIFGNRVFNEDIPTNLPSGLQSIDLDSCGNIIDGDFIDLPEYKLRFYKKLKLDPAEPGSLKSWYISDGSGGSILKDAIPFKYDPVNSSYRQFCYRRTSVGPPATYFQIQQYSNPTFWLFDYKSGFLEFYGDEATLTPYFTATDGPHFSFFKYIGEKGAAGGGGGGDASGNLDLSGNLSVGGDADISGNLTVVGDASFCNVLVNCDLDVSGNTDMSGNLTVDGNISVVGDADFCNVLVRCDLDVSGNTDLSQNLLQATASTDLTASGVTDYNAYFRQSNMIDSMKLPFSTYFDGFWAQMVERSRGWIKGSTSPFGPNLIPIAKININSSYNSNFPAEEKIELRSLLANTIGYFTLKFSQPSMDVWEDNQVLRGFSQNGKWKDVLPTKSGYNCIPEQTIHFIAGYQEQEYDDGSETRNPKPFIKVISSSIGDIRNLNGSVVEFANEQVIRIGGLYSGNKIGGITRIIIAEGGFTYPAATKGIPYEDFNTKDKAWLLIEQDWSYETWMRLNLPVQKEVIEKICKNHTIDVRLYKNNTGALMQKTPGAVGQPPSRPNGPDEMIIASELNTDWQLLSNDFIVRNFVDKWSLGQQPSFLLKGLPNTIFNPPADVDNLPNPPIPATTTLFVGGQQNPIGLPIGRGETFTNKFWFVDLNVYNWPYGITTTKEIFKFNVDVCGDLDVSGNLGVVGNSTFENITVTNNLDVQGDTTLKNTTVDGKIRADIVESSGNSIFVSYKNYNNSDFPTNARNSSPNTLPPNWCTIAELDNSVSNKKNSCIFQIIDKTGGVRQNLTFIIGVNEGNQKVFTINVLENNYSYWLSSSGNPKMPLIRNLQVIGSSSKYFLQLDRVAQSSSAPPTNVDVRLYLNTNDAGSGGDLVVPWILKSTGASGSTFLSISLQDMIYDINGIPEAGGNIITNMYSVNLNGAKFGKRVDMSNENIEYVNQLKGNNNTINFNNSNNLKLNAQNKLEFGTNTSTNDIIYDNNTLDFQSTNKIENLSKINETGGTDITIGNSSNNVSLNANDININSSNDTSITSTNDININFANGKTMFIDSSYTLGGYQPVEYSENKLNLRTTDLQVKTITNTTKDYLSNPSVKIDICGNVYEFTKTELDFNNKNIQELAKLNTTGTTLNIGNNTSGAIIFDSDRVEMETLTLNNTRITTNSNTTSTSVPYSWGIKYIEQEDASDTNLVGMYKQIRSGFITSSTNFNILFTPSVPPTPTSSKLPLDDNEIWDLSNSNFSSTNRQFTISNNISRTKMTINIQLGIKHINNTANVGHTISQLIEFWLGKNNDPVFKNIFTIERSYNFNQPRLFWYNGTITLIGGDSTFSKDFTTNDTFYFTCQQSGTATNIATIEQLRINITWEALN